MKTKSRKQTRKEFRKAKKLKKHEFFSKKKPKNQEDGENLAKAVHKGKPSFVKIEDIDHKVEKLVVKGKNLREFRNPQEVLEFERQKERKQKAKLDRQIRQQRIKQLKADNMKEDVEIQKLEKQLKMHNGKSKAFEIDGLDYLLDICEKKTSKNAFPRALEDSDSEFQSDLENIFGESPRKRPKNKKKSFNESENELEDSALDESDFDKEEREAGEEFSDLEPEISENKGPVKKSITNNRRESNQEDDNFKAKKKKVTFKECENDISDVDSNDSKILEMPKVWEDIYGRTRDEKGNIVDSYTAHHLRKKTEEGNLEKLVRLKKQLKGLLNRLSESNMSFISNQIEHLYMSNSRNDMNETLCNLFRDSLMTENLTPERLITEHAMLIAVLYANIGSEIGAHFLQHYVTEFCRVLEVSPDVEDKRINNILIFILQLYNFQIFHSKLIFDIINKLLKNLSEKQIELLLITFRTVGFNLRRDDPLALKSLVLNVQEQANSISTGQNSSRVKFMLEMLMAIKNNNMSKIPNYNPEFVEKLKKNLKVLVRKGNYSSELRISLQDLLNAEKHGRWWIVGSAWSGSAPSQPSTIKPVAEEVPSAEFSQKLLDLAKKQRMNTDVRRNIFCILMSAEDFLEAFEKLLQLKLKGAVEREIMNILIHCALQEKNFNLYYMYLANKFCIFDRKYQMMLQCAIWDKVKELKNASPFQVTNLAKFVGNIIIEKGLPLSILKVIQFSDLDKPTIKFMRQVLLTILVNDDRNAVMAVFKRIADSPKLKLFRESLRLFLQHFVAKTTAKNIDEGKVSRLAEMIKVAEQALTSSDSSMVF